MMWTIVFPIVITIIAFYLTNVPEEVKVDTGVFSGLFMVLDSIFYMLCIMPAFLISVASWIGWLVYMAFLV